MASLRKVPLSGDELTDWIFGELIITLQKKTVKVIRKRRLFDPTDPPRKRRAIRGLTIWKTNLGDRFLEIYINPAQHKNREEETQTLLHEAGHATFGKREVSTKRLENILTKKITLRQRKFLKSFLPRYETK